MDADSRQIIRRVLNGLDQTFIENSDFRIPISQTLWDKGIYYKIPDLVNFKFQIYFSQPDGQRELRQKIVEELQSKYGGSYENNDAQSYLTIYLPDDNSIRIDGNEKRILDIIKKQIEISKPILLSLPR